MTTDPSVFHDTPCDNFLASFGPDPKLSDHPEGRSCDISFIIVVIVDVSINNSCETKKIGSKELWYQRKQVIEYFYGSRICFWRHDPT